MKRMNNWISVKDRMPIEEYKEFKKMYPDDAFEVIVMIKGSTISTVSYTDGVDFWDYEDCDCLFYDVTHWMPLPEPPKGYGKNVSTELKPCPFCGREAYEDDGLNIDPRTLELHDAYVGCPRCDICFVEKTIEEARNKWNRRADNA